MKSFYQMLVYLLLAMGSGLPANASTNATVFPLHDWGPLFLSDTSLSSNTRFRVAGPIMEWQQDDSCDRSFSAVRPFYSACRDARRDKDLHDLMWPVGNYRRLGKESFWRFLWMYGRDKDNSAESRFQVMALPFGVYGRDSEGGMYMALFPFGGEIREFLFFDYIRFALFPIYLSTAVNGIVSQSYLWPFFSRTKGDGVDKLRIFPFYGISHEEGKATRKFIMWPVWNSVNYEYPDETGGGFVLFPFFGHIKTERQETWMAVPPLIRSSTSPGFREVHCPWPFVQYRNRDGDKKLYLWPLWGTKQNGPVRSSFFLWPIVGTRHVEKASTTRKHFRVVPFFFADSTTRHETSTEEDLDSTAEEVTGRYWKLWPLASYRRQENDRRFRLLELWPLKHTGPIDRNYAPIWTLYQRESNGTSMQEEFLWGLYNRRKASCGSTRMSVFPFFKRDSCPAEDRSSWSVLSGLIGCRRDSLRRTLKLLYFLEIPLDKNKEPDEPGTQGQ